MKKIIRYGLTVIAMLCCIVASTQTKLYSSEQASALRNSLAKSRWDAGGAVSKYSFRYMAELFPVGIIHKSDNAFNFPYTPQRSIDSIKVESKNGSLSLEQYFNKLHLTSFIVVHKGNIVYEKYFSMLPGDQYTLQSVTKVITSTLITSLINEKKIGIDEPINKYITELTGTEWQAITVRNILHMKSGMDSKSIDFASGPFTNPLHKNYQLESALGILPKAGNTPSSVYEFLKAMKRDTTAGSAAQYSNINTFVLGWLAEKVTGQKYVDLVAERIWKPMGASSNAYVCLSDKGIPWYHGGVSATLRDLARFGMLFTKSEIEKRKESIISFNQLKEIFDARPIEASALPFKWTYQWDLASNGIIMKGGFGGQALLVHPEKEIVIAFYNYIDEDWSEKMVSDQVIMDIIKGLER